MRSKEFSKYNELPEELIVQLTSGCNLRCSYCFQYKEKVRMMSKDMAKKCIDFIMSKDDGNIKVVNFYGGEPMLNLDSMEALVDRYIENRNNGNTTIIYFYINTNGTIINERFINIVKKITKYNMFRYCLSINGNKESHDFSRKDINGNGTFDKIMQNVAYLKKEIPNIFIEGHAVVDRPFIKNLKENIKFMIENKLFDEATTEPMFFGTEEEYTKEDYEKMVDVYRELLDEGYDNNKLNIIFEAFLEDNNYKNISYGCPRICVPGKHVICIDTEGKFLPCDFYLHLTDYSKYYMGDIDGNFEEYNKRVKYYKDLKNDLLLTPYSCKSENGTACKEECNCSSECQICHSIMEIATEKRLVVPNGMCERTKLMCEVFKNKKFIKY